MKIELSKQVSDAAIGAAKDQERLKKRIAHLEIDVQNKTEQHQSALREINVLKRESEAKYEEIGK